MKTKQKWTINVPYVTKQQVTTGWHAKYVINGFTLNAQISMRMITRYYMIYVPAVGSARPATVRSVSLSRTSSTCMTELL